MTILVWTGIGALGGLGAIARFHLDAVVQRAAGSAFPVGTFVVNTVGSCVLGVLTGLGVTGDAFLLTGTGLLGSFTTFSTWMLETERLGEDGETRLALANLALSVAGGLSAAALGWAVGARL
jgi:CrcB protein